MDPSAPIDDASVSLDSVPGELPLTAPLQAQDDRSPEEIASTSEPSSRESRKDPGTGANAAENPRSEGLGSPTGDPADGVGRPRELADEAPSEAAEALLPPEPAPPRQLHPLPRGLVELYGLLAVLFVLVPEWMAGGALFGFREGRQGTDLPVPSGAWTRLPELRLASLNLGELRMLARQLGVKGYGRLSREPLTTTLLRRLKAGR